MSIDKLSFLILLFFIICLFWRRYFFSKPITEEIKIKTLKSLNELRALILNHYYFNTSFGGLNIKEHFYCKDFLEFVTKADPYIFSDTFLEKYSSKKHLLRNKYDSKFYEVFDKIEIEIGRKSKVGPVMDPFYIGEIGNIHPDCRNLEIILRAFIIKLIEKDRISKNRFLTWFERIKSGE